MHKAAQSSRFDRIVKLAINRDEIFEHANQQGAIGTALEIFLLEPVSCLDQKPCAVFVGQQGARIKTIDENFIALRFELNEEVAGHSDPVQGETKAAPDQQVDGGQTDGDPHAPVYDPIQITVVGLIIVFRIAAKPLL